MFYTGIKISPASQQKVTSAEKNTSSKKQQQNVVVLSNHCTSSTKYYIVIFTGTGGTCITNLWHRWISIFIELTYFFFWKSYKIYIFLKMVIRMSRIRQISLENFTMKVSKNWSSITSIGRGGLLWGEGGEVNCNWCVNNLNQQKIN